MRRFAELTGAWMPVLPVRELRDGPVGLWLAGEPIALFRTPRGPAALIDRCPHRSAPLSRGRVVGGCLECPYHGWRFRGDGACVSVPLNPGARRERLGATACPLRVAGGLIWVFTGAAASGEPVVPEALLRPGVRVAMRHQVWRCHWSRAMENMLDAPHLPFVHRKSIGRGIRKQLRRSTRLHQDIRDTPTGFELRFQYGDGDAGTLFWVRPNGMVLDLRGGRWLTRLHVWCVPAESGYTRMVVAIARDFGLLNPAVALLNWVNHRVLLEDRSTVESIGTAPVPPPGSEMSVRTDRATLRFRAWYHSQPRDPEVPGTTAPPASSR